MGIKCRDCNKKAEVNIQKIWIKWDYNYKDDSYSDTFEALLDAEEPTGENNLHFCKKCFDKWMNGK